MALMNNMFLWNQSSIEEKHGLIYFIYFPIEFELTNKYETGNSQDYITTIHVFQTLKLVLIDVLIDGGVST
jgi:hypothetical protein